MKRRYINPIISVFIVMGAIVLLSLLLMPFSPVSKPSGENFMDMPKPQGVPPGAIFRGGLDGGYFISLSRNDLLLQNGTYLPAYKIGVYHSNSGEVEFEGIGLFVSIKEVSAEGKEYFYEPPSIEEIMSSAYYNGGELEFDIKGVSNAGRIIPLNGGVTRFVR